MLINPPGFPQQQGQQAQFQTQDQPQAQPTTQDPNMSLEYMMKAFIIKTENHMTKTENHNQNQGVALRNLENQVG